MTTPPPPCGWGESRAADVNSTRPPAAVCWRASPALTACWFAGRVVLQSRKSGGPRAAHDMSMLAERECRTWRPEPGARGRCQPALSGAGMTEGSRAQLCRSAAEASQPCLSRKLAAGLLERGRSSPSDLDARSALEREAGHHVAGRRLVPSLPSPQFPQVKKRKWARRISSGCEIQLSKMYWTQKKKSKRVRMSNTGSQPLGWGCKANECVQDLVSWSYSITRVLAAASCPALDIYLL